MRYHFNRIRGGKKRLNWLALTLFGIFVYAFVVGLAEAFWLGFTGGLSPLVGLYAVVAATLVNVRVVGTSLTMPEDLVKTSAGGV